MSLTADQLHALLDAFENASWQELDVRVGSTALRLVRQPPNPSGVSHRANPRLEPTASPTSTNGSAPGSSAAVSLGDVAVTAPSVGVVRRGPDAASPPFVRVGTRVDAADVIATLEVHRVAKPIRAGTAGVVTAVFVEDGCSVQYGDAVMLLTPDA